MKTSIIKMLALLFAIMVSSAVMAQSAEDFYNKGIEFCRINNYTEAIEWFRNAAEQGNVDALNELGICNEYALGVPQNINEAVNWYRKAAEGGHAAAQFNLGRCYQNGAGVTLNYTEAVKWYRKAANQGMPNAQYNLGVCYYNGLGLPQNYNEAVKWYRKAADQGMPEAQHNLGICYFNGQGVTQDFNESAKWYRKAAMQGQAISQNNLGMCYLEGVGVDKNYTEAFSWFKISAEQGYITAQYNMGHCYENGFGVTKNIAEAVKWYQKSAEQGYENAKLALERIKNTNSNIDTQSESQLVISEIDTDIPTVEGLNDNSFVVIFANEKYQEVAPVEYALNDGETFKKYCKSVLGIPEKNIHMRKNATKNNMITELSWMKKVADAYNGEAKFIVYYAGHGIPSEKSNAAYLLPVDGIANDPETAYSMTTFYQKLGNLNAAHVTVFMDACFSGAQRGEGMLASARGVVITPRTEAPSGKMVVFSAAQGDETAYPYKEMGHGLFTYYLLKKLRETKGNCTLQELGDYIQKNVKRQSIVVNSKSQTPTVSASRNLTTSWKTMKLR